MGGDKLTGTDHDIRFEHVTFGYNQHPVLNDMSVHMKEGTLTSIVGPSGSGKSTMLRLITRFYDPQGGKIWFGGTDQS
ncbi:Iron import ATP-binding/permease protein IrtA [compost metagenome]